MNIQQFEYCSLNYWWAGGQKRVVWLEILEICRCPRLLVKLASLVPREDNICQAFHELYQVYFISLLTEIQSGRR